MSDIADLVNEHAHRSIQHDGETYIKLADASVTFSLYRKDIAAKDAEIAHLRAWRDALNNELTNWLGPLRDGEKPKDALRRLMAYEVTAALDPAVSQAAADLVANARREGMEDARNLLETLHKNHKYNPLTGEGSEHDVGYYRALAEGAAHILVAAAKEGKP